MRGAVDCVEVRGVVVLQTERRDELRNCVGGEPEVRDGGVEEVVGRCGQEVCGSEEGVLGDDFLDGELQGARVVCVHGDGETAAGDAVAVVAAEGERGGGFVPVGGAGCVGPGVGGDLAGVYEVAEVGRYWVVEGGEVGCFGPDACDSEPVVLCCDSGDDLAREITGVTPANGVEAEESIAPIA